ncbi:putative cytochrome P450 [Lophium mytilinum]|uniref:Putative cytochrome P450 n=1 Tax=Lophium mytilinum TaxID=390894 RepID=A0A6A6QY41_9PEZI|nr:putative cytochrome P450 [Lophium mytilinum]
MGNKLWLAAAASVGLTVMFVVKLITHRRMFRNLPGPPHSWLFGHLPVMGKIAASMPPDANPQAYAHYIKQEYGLGDFFYMDLWPLTESQLVACEPEIAAYITQVKNFDKGAMISKFMEPLVGKKSVVALNGAEWKMVRRVLNPGFAISALQQHIPKIIDDAQIFAGILEGHAKKGDVFHMEEAVARVIINIMCRVALDIDCKAQTEDHPLTAGIRMQADLQPVALMARYLPDPNLYRRWQRANNTKKINKLIVDIVQDRVAKPDPINAEGKKVKKHHFVDLALEAFNEQTDGKVTGISPQFLEMMTSQIKSVIFAGHDSSANTVCYIFHELSRHPAVLAKVRAELDEILGTDVDAAADIIKANPALLNKMDYTLAVIKETLRKWPPIAGSYRFGSKEHPLSYEGQTYPTWPFACYVNDYAIMRNADVFPNPLEFNPERFLVPDGHPLAVPKNAWRPFEKGPRFCVGEAMALVQTKVILVSVIRKFDIAACYEGPGPEMEGERMYQTLHVTAKPKDSMPARVTYRK